MIDGRAETKTRALFGDMVGSPMFIFVSKLLSPALVASRSPRTRLRMYFAAPAASWRSLSQRGLILNVETAKSGSPEADKGDRQFWLSREIEDLILLIDL